MSAELQLAHELVPAPPAPELPAEALERLPGAAAVDPAPRGAQPARRARRGCVHGDGVSTVGGCARPLLRTSAPLAARRIAAGPDIRAASARGEDSRTLCAVSGCRFPSIADHGLCDSHHRSFGWLARRRPGLGPADYVAHLATAREQIRPRFELCGVGPVVALELSYALQCRHDQRGAAITPLIFGQVVRWLRDQPVDSLLIGSDAAWARAAAGRFTANGRRNPLAWVRYSRSDLRDRYRRPPRGPPSLLTR